MTRNQCGHRQSGSHETGQARHRACGLPMNNHYDVIVVGVGAMGASACYHLARPEGEIVAGSLQSARQHGLPHELLDGSELARRFPVFRVPEEWVGLLEPRAGFLVPERVIAAYAEAALRRGAELHGREKVT